MTTDAIYKERGSDWSHQVFVVGTTWWLQRDQTLPLSAKGVACETNLISHEKILYTHEILLDTFFSAEYRPMRTMEAWQSQQISNKHTELTEQESMLGQLLYLWKLTGN